MKCAKMAPRDIVDGELLPLDLQDGRLQPRYQEGNQLEVSEWHILKERLPRMAQCPTHNRTTH